MFNLLGFTLQSPVLAPKPHPRWRPAIKDLTLSDYDNNMYLGPLVAAQQVLDPSPQTSHPLKEKKGGGGTSAAVKSSGV